MKEQLLFAYLAGMIDADGYITIQRSFKQHVGKCRPALYHCLSVGIGGTDRRPHDLAASIFGGNTQCYHPKNKKPKDQFQWSVSGPKAVMVLENIGPYLLIKKRQAELGLEFQHFLRQHRPPLRITDIELEARDKMCFEVQMLNNSRSRGPRHKTRTLFNAAI